MTTAARHNASGNSIWCLRTTALFSELSESFYNSATERLEEVKFRKGDVFDFQDAGEKCFYILAEGQVKLQAKGTGGKEVILDIAGPEDIFGPIEKALPGSDKPAGPLDALATEAVGLADGTALRMRLSYLEDLIERRPSVLINLSTVLGERTQRLEVRLIRLLYRSSLGKVAGLVLELAERYGRKEGNELVLELPVTHQDLASILGLRRASVTEALAELELRELLRAKRGLIRVLMPKELDEVG